MSRQVLPEGPIAGTRVRRRRPSRASGRHAPGTPSVRDGGTTRSPGYRPGFARGCWLRGMFKFLHWTCVSDMHLLAYWSNAHSPRSSFRFDTCYLCPHVNRISGGTVRALMVPISKITLCAEECARTRNGVACPLCLKHGCSGPTHQDESATSRIMQT